MSWLTIVIGRSLGLVALKKDMPSVVWSKYPNCGVTLDTEELHNIKSIGPRCKYHYSITTRNRLKLFFDRDSQTMHIANVSTVNILKLNDIKTYKTTLDQS
ncbi:hypothetical protein [Francisella tularensis]|uniref:hypothetical protein n=1 Tax=Francisella tularensis TaxID=263 RepID=UPI0016813C4E|nr:hypothetical protein [Francisella tularensis]MBD2809129.1 hypothetical protein [Francisella tularensis]